MTICNNSYLWDCIFCRPEQKEVPLPFHVRSVGHYRFGQGKRGLLKKCPFVQLFWCVEGCGSFHFPDGEVHLLKAGEICFHPEGALQNFGTGPEGYFHYRGLSFEGPLAMNFFESFHMACEPAFAGPPPERLFEEIRVLLRRSDARAAVEAFRKAVEIITLAAEARTLRETENSSRAEFVREIIDSEFRDSSLDVNTLADRLGMHRVSLSRLFSKKFQNTLSDYLRKKRLDAAAENLGIRKTSVAEAARLSGFASVCGFSRLFHKTHGVSPEDYRAGKRGIGE